MAVISQPLPWTMTGSRELADSNGNIVQYTHENLGMICLAVNAHANLLDTVAKAQTMLQDSTYTVADNAAIIAVLEAASGRIGFAALAAKIEASAAPSPDLDRAISVEMQIPEGAYTSDLNAAFKLLPAGWAPTASTMPQLNHETGETVQMALVTLTNGTKTVTGTSVLLPLSICSAALKAMES